MKVYQADSICNIALAGHGSEGKTTLAEAMLFAAGMIDRTGRIEDGSTVMDYDSEETKRGITINAAMAPIEWKDSKINLLDTPGYFDFAGELIGCLRAVDAAMIVVGSTSGLTVGAEKAWAYAAKRDVPRAFVVNQIDRENANFQKVVAELAEAYGPSVVPVMLPIMQGQTYKGYVDVLSGKAYEFAGKAVKEVPVPDALADEMQEALERLSEAVAGADDALMEKYFENGELSQEDMSAGMGQGIAQGLVVPVLATSATQGLGIAATMDFIAQYMPKANIHAAYEGVNPKNDAREKRTCDPTAPFAAQVFKTLADPFVGRISLVKIISGVLDGNTTAYNPNIEKNEKLGSIGAMLGKKLLPLDQVMAGDICALAKLQFTQTGHTLCDPAKPIVFDGIEFPKPCISLAVYAKKQGDEDKIFSGLHKLEEEDPSFKVEKSTTTTETLISGQGELHLEVISKKLLGKYGVEAQLNDPKIPYRETIKKAVKAEGRHKKQSGGHGQFGHCWIEFEPLYDSDVEFEFVDKVVGGVVPRQYIPAVEKGLRENLPKGVIAGYPMVNIRATLYDGSYHAVDSSEMAFKTAARLALRKGCQAANPVLLEPIQTVRVYVPDEYMGDIIGDMNRRRGRIMGMNPAPDGGQCVEAEVPITEMFKYATDLRSMTQGRGSFDMEFARYEEVPANLAQKIIENAKIEADEEE